MTINILPAPPPGHHVLPRAPCHRGPPLYRAARPHRRPEVELCERAWLLESTIIGERASSPAPSSPLLLLEVELQRDLENAGERSGVTLRPAGATDDAAALVGKAPAVLALGLLAFALLTLAPDSAAEWPAERAIC
jgi:hypothetical protein